MMKDMKFLNGMPLKLEENFDDSKFTNAYEHSPCILLLIKIRMCSCLVGFCYNYKAQLNHSALFHMFLSLAHYSNAIRILFKVIRYLSCVYVHLIINCNPINKRKDSAYIQPVQRWPLLL